MRGARPTCGPHLTCTAFFNLAPNASSAPTSKQVAGLLYSASDVPYVTQYCFRKLGFRAGFRPDPNRESLKIGPAAGRADFDDLPNRIQPKCGPEARFYSPEAILQLRVRRGRAGSRALNNFRPLEKQHPEPA